MVTFVFKANIIIFWRQTTHAIFFGFYLVEPGYFTLTAARDAISDRYVDLKSINSFFVVVGFQCG
jgi:hypothetical protein